MEAALEAIGRFIEAQGVAVFLSIMYAALTWKALSYMREKDKSSDDNQKRDNDQIDHTLDILATAVGHITPLEETVKENTTAVKQQTVAVDNMQHQLKQLVNKEAIE